jgi:ribose transport system ATP-binding protein
VAAALHVSGVSKAFNGRTVLHPLTLTVEAGTVHMLLGQNGSGKSTLIKVLAGYHEPDSLGEFVVGGRSLGQTSPDAAREAGLRFVHQDLGLIGSETVLDNVLLANGYSTRFGSIRTKEALARVSEALARVGLSDLSPYDKVERLSPAQRTGVAIARAIVPSEHPVAALVLDEPTATLPPHEVGRLHEMLRNATSRGIGVLYVTHHLEEVGQLADDLTILRDGRVAESTSARSLDHDGIVERLIGGALEVADKAVVVGDAATARPRLVVDALVGERLRGMTFTSFDGEILGIYGLTGSGRENLLATIFGATPKHSGRVELADKPGASITSPLEAIRAGVAFVPPDRKVKGGFMDLTASENLVLPNLRPFMRRGFLRRRPELENAREWFRRLDVRPVDGVNQPLSTFSGGNQQKIVMAKWLRLQPSVLLLDEPTQGVDVAAKAELHRQILQARDTGTSVLVSSTDVEELVAICDRVLIVDQGQVKKELVGSDVTEHNINEAFLAAAEGQE